MWTHPKLARIHCLTTMAFQWQHITQPVCLRLLKIGCPGLYTKKFFYFILHNLFSITCIWYCSSCLWVRVAIQVTSSGQQQDRFWAKTWIPFQILDNPSKSSTKDGTTTDLRAKREQGCLAEFKGVDQSPVWYGQTLSWWICPFNQVILHLLLQYYSYLNKKKFRWRIGLHLF